MQFLRWSFCLFADFLEGEITMLKFNSKDRIVTDATLAKQIAGKEKSEVLKQLDTSINGLSPTQAKKRLERDGLNEVSNKECHPRLHFSTLSQVLSTILSNFILKYRPNREMAPGESS